MPKHLIRSALLAVALVWACAGSALAAEALPSIKYVLEPVPSAEGLHFRIELSFKGDPSGTTRIELPLSWASARDLDKGIRNLTVASKGATLADTSEPNLKTISHAPGQTLVIRYELVQVKPGPPAVGPGGGYSPILQKDFFHWIGYGAWIQPAWGDSARATVTLEWRGLPKGWSVSNSYGSGKRRQKIETQLGALEHAVYVGGDFRVVERRVGGKPVVIAMRGAWKFTDADFAGLVERVVTLERDFWRDYDYPYFLVTMIPLDGPPNAFSIGGTALTNSFATFVTTNVKVEDLRFLLAHELFHNWNSQKLGRFPDPEQLSYWISEGFTDFYTHALLLRGGLYTQEEFVAKYNDTLKAYYLSPARDATNERIAKEFFTDRAVGQLPYWRGALLAMKWDTQIRRATAGRNSLDDVMHALFADAKQSPDRLLTIERIDELVRRYTGESVMADVERYIVAGAMIPPDPNGLGDGYRIEEVDIRTFDLGLDLDTLVKKKEIAGVRPDGAAFAAGLRDGQTLVRRKPIHVGDATKPVEITIKEGDSETTITYLPAGAGVKVPQYISGQ